MSTLETILSRAMSDPAFADLLFADAEKAVTGYDLSAEELASLKSLSRVEFDKLSAAAPEERKSLAFMAHISIKGNKQGQFKGEGTK